ncbi:MAG: hypothetical protein K8H88_24020, partial [Sandaracinaceae bacterium]|nr:hypothetical protein [Sandaracinaceae bacterium]
MSQSPPLGSLPLHRLWALGSRALRARDAVELQRIEAARLGPLFVTGCLEIVARPANGKRIALGGHGRTSIWSLDPSLRDPIYLAVSSTALAWPDKDRLAIGTREEVLLVEAKKVAELWRRPTPVGPVRALGARADDLLVLGTEVLAVLDVTSGDERARVDVGGTRMVAWDGGLIVGGRGGLVVLDRQLTEIGRLSPSSDDVLDLAVEGDLLVCAHGEAGTELRTLPDLQSAGHWDFDAEAFGRTTDGTLVAASARHGSLHAIDIRARRVGRSFGDHHDHSVEGIVHGPTKEHVVSVSFQEGAVRVGPAHASVPWLGGFFEPTGKIAAVDGGQTLLVEVGRDERVGVNAWQTGSRVLRHEPLVDAHEIASWAPISRQRAVVLDAEGALHFAWARPPQPPQLARLQASGDLCAANHEVIACAKRGTLQLFRTGNTADSCKWRSSVAVGDVRALACAG